MGVAMFNIYRLMFPLAMIDLSPYAKDDFVRPLWEEGAPVHLRVYLSTRHNFNVAFLSESFKGDRDLSEVQLVWDELVHETTPSFSKSFLLTTSLCNDTTSCQDKSFEVATKYLDQAEQQAVVDRGEAGILSVLSAAGQGSESTSVLLSFYTSAAKHLGSVLKAFGLASQGDDGQEKVIPSLLHDRTTISMTSPSPLWSALQRNATLYAHVVLIKADKLGDWPPNDFEETKEKIVLASRSHSLLLGSVKLVKWELPNHVNPPSRILCHDLVYIFKRLVSGTKDERPPWDMKYAKPIEYEVYETAQHMKRNGIGYSYWKPMVSVKYMNELVEYPMELVHLSGMPLVQLRPSVRHPTGVSFTPAIHVDEIGLTSEKYIPINETVTSLPLRISFDRSDIDHAFSTASATAGGISPSRWRLLTHLSQAIESQKALGFDESDIDDVRRLIADTNGK